MLRRPLCWASGATGRRDFLQPLVMGGPFQDGHDLTQQVLKANVTQTDKPGCQISWTSGTQGALARSPSRCVRRASEGLSRQGSTTRLSAGWSSVQGPAKTPRPRVPSQGQPLCHRGRGRTTWQHSSFRTCRTNVSYMDSDRQCEKDVRQASEHPAVRGHLRGTRVCGQ